MPVDPNLIHNPTPEELRRIRAITDKYLSKRSLPVSRLTQSIDPFEPEWFVGPEDVSNRELSDAYNTLVRNKKIPRNMSLQQAAKSPQMESELYSRGLIRKEFAPAGRVYDGVGAEALPRAGAEIKAAGARIPKGLAKYKTNPDLIKRILSGQDTGFERAVLPEVESEWRKILGKLNTGERREVAARFRQYFHVQGKGAVESLVEGEVASQAAIGRMSYINPLDVGRVTSREMRTDILAKEISRQHIRTGAFLSEEALAGRGMSATDINSLNVFGGYKRPFVDKVQAEAFFNKYGIEVDEFVARSRYVPGSRGEEKLLRRLMPDLSGDPQVDFREVQLGAAKQEAVQDVVESQARVAASTRRKQVILRENEGATSAFYSSKPRAAALRRARGREAMRVQEAMMPRPELAVPVGKPYAPASIDLRASRKLKSLAVARRTMPTPTTGRAAAQASTALTAANQAIKESALLPDIRRPGLLIPKGKLPLELKPFGLTGDLLKKYPGTTKGIEVMLGSKRLGMVPYGGAAGGGGALINKMLESKSTAAYLQSQGKASYGSWAKMTLLSETQAGRMLPIRNVPVAGISFGEFGKVAPVKEAARATRMESSVLLKKWMDRVPGKYKMGALAVGMLAGALLIKSKDRSNEPLILNTDEASDANMYGGATGGMQNPEGMEEQPRGSHPGTPNSYSARVMDPNSVQTNIRIKGRTGRSVNFEAVGRAMGLTASNTMGAEVGNVNVRVMDDSRKMNDQYIKRKLERII